MRRPVLKLPISLLVISVAATLFVADCKRAVETAGDTEKNAARSHRPDVAEVVVTAARPAWVMPEVVVRGSRAQGRVAWDSPSSFFAN
jgi:hypothetical protein